MLFDVIIVGYGPVGQALALQLLRQGRRVAIVERWPELYALPRAVGYDHEVARIMQSLGLAEALRPFTCPSAVYEWRNARGDVLLEYAGRDNIAISGWPQSIGFHQPSLEALLDSHIRRFGEQAVLRQGWEACALRQEADRVTITIRGVEPPTTAEQTLQSRYVVGCDGAGSFVRQAMGSSYRYLGFTADWLVVDIRPANPPPGDPPLIQYCDPARPSTLVTGGPGRSRMEFMLLPGEDKAAMNTPEQAWRLLANHGWTPDNAVLERHAVYTFRGAVADHWHKDRVLLAGDAAHLTPPFAAQGLCAGLRDVHALAWRLDLLLDGIALPSILESYGPERSEHARVLIDFAIDLGNVICVLDPDLAEVRDQRMLAGDRTVSPTFPLPRLGASPLQDNDDPHAGVLAMQARVRRGDRVGLLDDLVGHGFMLLSLDEERALGLSPAQWQFLEEIRARVVCFGARSEVRDIDGSYRRWFESLGCRSALVRPDFYLFGTGNAAELVAKLGAAPVWQRQTDRLRDTRALTAGQSAR